MLKFTTLQFLYKQKSMFDTVFSPNLKIKLTINDQYQYFTLQQSSRSDKIYWDTSQILPIELPPFKKQHQFKFQLYKNNNYVGRARSFVIFGRNKKDCLDILTKNFEIIGKFLYQIKWAPKTYSTKMITLDEYFKFGYGTTKVNPYTTVGLQQSKRQQDKRKKSRTKVRNRNSIFQYNEISEDEEEMSCFSCFSSKKNKSVLDDIQLKRLQNFPLIYKESQLDLKKNEGLLEQQIIRPMYYSKRFYRIKRADLKVNY